MASVDWELARRVASRVNRTKPFSEPSSWGSLEADFAELTPLAEDLVAAETGLHSNAGTARSKVIDRLGWVDANLRSFDRLMRPLLESFDTSDDEGRFFDRITGPISDLTGPKVAAAEVGSLLGWMSGRVLGQYDLLIVEDDRPQDQDWVYYVGPNIKALEERYGFSQREFRLWIAVHECTHRAQFTGVEWLRPYFLSLVNELLDEVDPNPSKMMDTMGELIRKKRSGDEGETPTSGGLASLLASPEQKLVLDKMTGLMSLLEGHGDVTMDRAAKDLIPSQARFSRILSARRKSPTAMAKVVFKVTGMDAKMAQYDEGEKFVYAVEEAGGRELFDNVWSGPESLPTIDEIRDPNLWISRHR